MIDQPSSSKPEASTKPLGDTAKPDRIGPRPLDRPAVDPAHVAVFGRPAGVAGAFDPSVRRADPNGSLWLSVPPPEALATAFGRPRGTGDTLQRPPGDYRDPVGDQPKEDFWSDGETDPWRNPGAGVVLGPPAVGEDRQGSDSGKHMPGPMLSVPELLFGRRVAPTALLALLLAALLVGAVGGVVGWLIGSSGNGLTSDSATLTPVEQSIERAPGSIAAIARKVAPAVVSLEVQAGNVGAVGSGVVIDPTGYVITNNHVVSVGGLTTPKITAVFTDGTRTSAAVVGTDPKTDLAVVKVNVTNPTVIQLGRSADLAVGDPVIAIGSPLGLASTVTSGIVSALHRAISVPSDNGGPAVTFYAVQTDAAINHGNSGGALVDSTGALVGINSVISQTSENGGNIGLGFAIPVDEARVIAQGLIRNGKVVHASLGVNVRSVSANSSEGAQIANVPAGGAAAKAGLTEGDVITKLGDRQITNAEELQAAVLERVPGDQVTVHIVRQGVAHDVQVTLQSDEKG